MSDDWRRQPMKIVLRDGPEGDGLNPAQTREIDRLTAALEAANAEVQVAGGIMLTAREVSAMTEPQTPSAQESVAAFSEPLYGITDLQRAYAEGADAALAALAETVAGLPTFHGSRVEYRQAVLDAIARKEAT